MLNPSGTHTQIHDFLTQLKIYWQDAQHISSLYPQRSFVPDPAFLSCLGGRWTGPLVEPKKCPKSTLLSREIEQKMPWSKLGVQSSHWTRLHIGSYPLAKCDLGSWFHVSSWMVLLRLCSFQSVHNHIQINQGHGGFTTTIVAYSPWFV